VATNDTIWNILMEKYRMPREKSRSDLSLYDLVLNETADYLDSEQPVQRIVKPTVRLTDDGELMDTRRFKTKAEVAADFSQETLSAEQIRLLDECIYLQGLRISQLSELYYPCLFYLAILLAALPVFIDLQGYVEFIRTGRIIIPAVIAVIALVAVHPSNQNILQSGHDLALTTSSRYRWQDITDDNFAAAKRESWLRLEALAHILAYDQIDNFNPEELYLELINSSAFEQHKSQRELQAEQISKQLAAEMAQREKIDHDLEIRAMAEQLLQEKKPPSHQ
jgi:hypothetical protein